MIFLFQRFNSAPFPFQRGRAGDGVSVRRQTPSPPLPLCEGKGDKLKLEIVGDAPSL